MSDEAGARVYMLKCADESYYVGSARLGLDRPHPEERPKAASRRVGARTALVAQSFETALRASSESDSK
jgi:predicted GIY-YIG superfamily endonuclease